MTESINVTDYTPQALQAKLFAALAKAQAKFEPIEKNRTVEIRPRDKAPYTFRYADLQEILAKTRKALTDNGLALFQIVEDGVLRCVLTHQDGGSITSSLALPTSLRDMHDPKALGALISYLRRYQASAILGVAADDDLDQDGEPMGNATTGTAAPADKTDKPAMPARRSEKTQAPNQQAEGPATDRPVTAGEMKWLDNKLSAKGWTIGHAIEQAGLDPVAEGAQLMLSQFNAIKKVL